MRRSKSLLKNIPILMAVFCLSSSLIFMSCTPSTGGTTENKGYDYTAVDDSNLEDMTALQLTTIMGNGINLGNTMEATSGIWMGYNAPADSYETGWGQPVTTKEMFVAMKEAGFDSVRIPVAWTTTMDWSHGSFKIRDDYIERVKTVVGWALDANLFVMINNHWDYGWWGLFSHDETLAWQIYESIWTQVGNAFKDYPLQLIFEGGNEEHGDGFNLAVIGCSCDGNHNDKNASCKATDPRLDVSKFNYGKGTLTEAQCYNLAAKVNQKFVDIVRNQGGKNEKRFLLIPGIETNFDKTTDDRYKMPTDSKNTVQKLIVSVHYYEPAHYALVSDKYNSWGYLDTWGTASDISTQDARFALMKKFTNKGYGVIIGEYGAAKKDSRDGGGMKDGMREWIKNILDNCDKYNFCPFLWDCSTFFMRKDPMGFQDQQLKELYKSRSYSATNK